MANKRTASGRPNPQATDPNVATDTPPRTKPPRNPSKPRGRNTEERPRGLAKLRTSRVPDDAPPERPRGLAKLRAGGTNAKIPEAPKVHEDHEAAKVHEDHEIGSRYDEDLKPRAKTLIAAIRERIGTISPEADDFLMSLAPVLAALDEAMIAQQTDGVNVGRFTPLAAAFVRRIVRSELVSVLTEHKVI